MALKSSYRYTYASTVERILPLYPCDYTLAWSLPGFRFFFRFCWNSPLSGQRSRTWPTTVSMGSTCSRCRLLQTLMQQCDCRLNYLQHRYSFREIICPFVLLTAIAVLYAPAFCEANTVARIMQYTEVLVTS